MRKFINDHPIITFLLVDSLIGTIYKTVCVVTGHEDCVKTIRIETGDSTKEEPEETET